MMRPPTGIIINYKTLNIDMAMKLPEFGDSRFHQAQSKTVHLVKKHPKPLLVVVIIVIFLIPIMLRDYSIEPPEQPKDAGEKNVEQPVQEAGPEKASEERSPRKLGEEVEKTKSTRKKSSTERQRDENNKMSGAEREELAKDNLGSMEELEKKKQKELEEELQKKRENSLQDYSRIIVSSNFSKCAELEQYGVIDEFDVMDTCYTTLAVELKNISLCNFAKQKDPCIEIVHFQNQTLQINQSSTQSTNTSTS